MPRELQIQASEAKTRFLQLLDDVERGASLIITRHGRPVARLIPETDAIQNRVSQAIADIREHRRHAKRMTVEEILSARNEGRK